MYRLPIWVAAPGPLLAVLLALAGASCSDADPAGAGPEISSATVAAPGPTGGGDPVGTTTPADTDYRVVYRHQDELFVDRTALGVETGGPPRWRPQHPEQISYIAKHGRYNDAGILAAIPDTVTVDLRTDTITVLTQLPAGAWDPDAAST